MPYNLSEELRRATNAVLRHSVDAAASVGGLGELRDRVTANVRLLLSTVSMYKHSHAARVQRWNSDDVRIAFHTTCQSDDAWSIQDSDPISTSGPCP
ncbi:hypothetical protein VTO73DRAFT_1386 [Trametes versicolor]